METRGLWDSIKNIGSKIADGVMKVGGLIVDGGKACAANAACRAAAIAAGKMAVGAVGKREEEFGEWQRTIKTSLKMHCALADMN